MFSIGEQDQRMKWGRRPALLQEEANQMRRDGLEGINNNSEKTAKYQN